MSLAEEQFKRVVAGIDKPSADEHNKIVSLLEKVARSAFHSGFIDSTGFHNRRLPSGEAAGFDLLEAEIKQGLTYPDPDPELAEGDPLILGYDHYKVRLTTTTYADYEPAKEYVEGDMIISEDKIYRCDVPIVGVQPPIFAGWENFWTHIEDIKIDRAIGHTEVQTDFDLRNYVPWYIKGEKVIIAKVIDDSEDSGFRYFIWQTLSWTGLPANASIRFNDNQERTMAVFK